MAEQVIAFFIYKNLPGGFILSRKLFGVRI